MLDRNLRLFFISILFLSNISCTKLAGFDEVCQIYTEANNSKMSKQDLNDYIFNNIAKRVYSPDALETHSIIFQVPSKERYVIFKQAAEASLKQNWDCAPMQILMNK